MQQQLYNSGTEHNAVQTFDFNGLTLRALLVEGEPWFARGDALEALGIRRDSQLVRNLPVKGVALSHPLPTAGGMQSLVIINESNLYRLIMRSDSEKAFEFQEWVTGDVLPAIRRTGAYEAPKSDAEKVLEVVQLLQAQVEESRRELEVARPKVATYDKVLTPEHTFGFRDLCKAIRDRLPVTEADVKRVLREKKILTPGFRLDVYSAAIDKGYAVRRPVGKWGGKERFQARFTTKTLEWLLAELAQLEEVA